MKKNTKLELYGFILPSYEYNDDQYPTSVSLTVPGLITQNTTITYDCK
ncbi:MAG: hypothetical protein P8I31_08000 [Bacteroidia bacterium]|nr:hypothetical protein [Bacteroidia bacterium]